MPSSDEDIEQPSSIAALRSKFEALAAGINNVSTKNVRKPASLAKETGQLSSASAEARGHSVSAIALASSRAGTVPIDRQPANTAVEPVSPPPLLLPIDPSHAISINATTPPLISSIPFEQVAHYEVSYGERHLPSSDIGSTPVGNPSTTSGSSTPRSLADERRRALPVPLKSLSAPNIAGKSVEDPVESSANVNALKERLSVQSPLAAILAGQNRSDAECSNVEASRSVPTLTAISRDGHQNASPTGLSTPKDGVGAAVFAASTTPGPATLRTSKPRPPPPPMPRSASPVPKPPDRSTKLRAIALASQTTAEEVLRDALSHRDTSGAALPEDPQLDHLHGGERPALPVRKPNIRRSWSTGEEMVAPPASGSHVEEQLAIPILSSAPNSGVPPRLPERSRAQSISKSVLLSQMPVRSATISLSGHASGKTGPQGYSSRTLGYPSPTDYSYQPPPPPSRTATAAFASPPRRDRADSRPMPSSTVVTDYASSDNDDDADAAPTSGLTATAKRMLEDYPDSTHANRRPPAFVPDLKIEDMHHVNCHAVYGRYICLGAHHVRVYDTLISDRPILTVDLKDTGLEFRMKDPRVTALCFRPAGEGNHVDEGRYLWCGTKDGHIWELDVKSGMVTDTKAFIHASPVTYILRYGSFLLTIEEGGKMNVFEVVKSTDAEARASWKPVLVRSVRLSEKLSYARLVRGRLWTATSPSVRSTTNTASKGPTIRVYYPCTRETTPPPKTAFTSEWTGSVTSVTFIPFHPGEVYMGHEGGFVSVWDEANLHCTKVIKISATDVTTLEGVGERLWAGNRKGQIWVYQVDGKPWAATNIWNAHGENALSSIYVDPWSIEHCGHLTVWSASRDVIRAWDGLLAVDWTDKQMITRQPDYCTFRDINVLVCSWNIDSAKPSDLAGSESNALFLDQLLGSVESPDVIVFGFQEVIPLSDKKLTARTLLFGSGKNKESNQTADKVSLAYRQWLDKLQYAVRLAMPKDSPYVKVHSESLVGLFTAVFVKSSQQDTLRDIDICTVKRGIGGIYGNKGAIVARMVMDDTSLCFINVHLAAGQRQKAARTADLAAIMEDKAILPASDELPFVNGGDGMAILDHEIVILSGDFNYRIDQRRENVLSSIAAGESSYLLEHDQLKKEMKSNQAFRLRSFDEAPITFNPTYKYNTGSTEYDSSEKNRIPAWCDRILYTRSSRIRNQNYQRYETTVSDHRPISAGFTVQLKAVDGARINAVRRDIASEWAIEEAVLLERMSVAFEDAT